MSPRGSAKSTTLCANDLQLQTALASQPPGMYNAMCRQQQYAVGSSRREACSSPPVLRALPPLQPAEQGLRVEPPAPPHAAASREAASPSRKLTAGSCCDDAAHAPRARVPALHSRRAGGWAASALRCLQPRRRPRISACNRHKRNYAKLAAATRRNHAHGLEELHACILAIKPQLPAKILRDDRLICSDMCSQPGSYIEVSMA